MNTSIDLLNKQLMDTMKELNIPQSLQITILNLSLQQKQAMLELYTRQRAINSNSNPSANDPLDAQLINRMNELYVPKHIQSQIITLPSQKKRILLDKYNTSHNSHIVDIKSFDGECYESLNDHDSIHSNKLEVELLDLMKQNNNNIPLQSIDKLKTLPKWKKKQYIESLQKKLISNNIDNKYNKKEEEKKMDNILVENELFDIMEELNKKSYPGSSGSSGSCSSSSSSSGSKEYSVYSGDTKLINQICLRCLKEFNMENTGNIKCIFHAFLSQAPEYDNIEYFKQRNNELYDAKDFKFACCNKICKGNFRNIESQQNGCHVLEKHLFDIIIKNNEIDSSDHIHDESKNEEFTDIQIEGDDTDYHKAEGNKKMKNDIIINLCGKWKMFVYAENKKSLLMICDIDIIKHSKNGQIEGYLIGTTYIEDNKYDNNKDKYSGQLNGNQLMLTYRGKQSYTASYLLNVEEFQLNGQWIASTHSRGTCKWFKIQKIMY